jgi:hypothetical protein
VSSLLSFCGGARQRDPGAIDASCAGIWRGDRRGAADGRVCHGGPRLGRQRLRFREPSGRAGQARSVDSPRLELTFATLTGLERYREYAGRSPSCQGVLLERYNWLSAQRRIRVSVRAGGARPSGSPNPNDRPSRRTVHRCRAPSAGSPVRRSVTRSLGAVQAVGSVVTRFVTTTVRHRRCARPRSSASTGAPPKTWPERCSRCGALARRQGNRRANVAFDAGPAVDYG